MLAAAAAAATIPSPALNTHHAPHRTAPHPPGTNVHIERLTLVNTTLGAPSDPEKSLRPVWLNTRAAASTWFVDVVVITSAEAVAAYAAYLNAAPPGDARYYTVRGCNRWVWRIRAHVRFCGGVMGI